MFIKGYKNLAVTTPECHPGTPIFCADFQLDVDISPLFPYINAVVDGAIYHGTPHCILFDLDKIKYSVYPDKVSAFPFQDREQAIAHIGQLIHFLNDLASRKAL